jgi:hypothetical protein
LSSEKIYFSQFRVSFVVGTCLFSLGSQFWDTLYKKGEKDTANNCRGITLLNTAYKVYAMIVEERLMKEMNERGVLPDGQAGFRKGRGTMDNVYILNHIIGNEIKKEG